MALQGGCGSRDAPLEEALSFKTLSSGGPEMAEVEEEHPAGAHPLSSLLSLITWKRPLWTSALFATTNIVFWLVSLSPCRVFTLVSSSLVLLVVMELLCKVMFSRSRGDALWRSMASSWEVIDSVQEAKSGSGAPFTDFCSSLRLFIEETSSFKQQNPGKFCLLVCSMCSFLALLGRYIPGVVISYILVLGIFLWPLVSSHEFGMWLEPVLQKLDFGVGEFLLKIKENHEKRILQSQTERESIEADLSALFPKVRNTHEQIHFSFTSVLLILQALVQMDSTVCRELSISDTEASEVTWTDNGTFNLSEGHTPQTESSDDSDRRSDEEVFTGGLPEFPSLDNSLRMNRENDEAMISAIPLAGVLLSRASVVEPPVQALEDVQKLAGDLITAAVTTALQEHLEAENAPALVQALAQDSDSEPEDFELLDQSELEQMEGELGLDQGKSSKPSPGFLSKLLGRH